MKIVSRRIDCMGIEIDFIVGQSAKENHALIDAADPNDLWFHIADKPSCHVIAKLPVGVSINKHILQKIVRQGATVILQQSRSGSGSKDRVEWTRIKNVTKLDRPGSVSVTDIRIIG